MKKLFVVVNGITYSQDDKLEIDANTEYYSLPWEYVEGDRGEQYPAYRAGVTTWKIIVAGEIVYHGTDIPTRTETEDSITYTLASPLTPDDTQEVAVVQKGGAV